MTLIQTGKSDLHPIVLLDPPGGTFWSHFDAWMTEDLIGRGFVSPEDRCLYKVTDDINESVSEIERFYRVYHSQRFVAGRLVLRLRAMPEASALAGLSEEFADIITRGAIETVEASAEEIKDEDAVDLPRIALWFDRMRFGRLRQLIDRLNDLAVEAPAATAR